jgi:hypothetical protein
MQTLSIIDDLPIKKYRFSIAMLYGGFPKWGYPKKWMVLILEIPI